MVELRPFHNGDYHESRMRELKDPETLAFHTSTLKAHYDRARHIIDRQGWRQPLDLEKPAVLLMGMEGYPTARTFVDYTLGLNSLTEITLADFSPKPLVQCADNGLNMLPNVSLVQADTTELDFPDESFDHIETDGLLQFLSPDQKRKAVAEWHRILRPGGIVTTRDRFVSIHDRPNEWDILNNVRRTFRRRFGVETYATTTEVMRYTFNKQGFSTVFPRNFLLHDIVAKKPDDAK